MLEGQIAWHKRLTAIGTVEVMRQEQVISGQRHTAIEVDVCLQRHHGRQPVWPAWRPDLLIVPGDRREFVLDYALEGVPPGQARQRPESERLEVGVPLPRRKIGRAHAR